jgi:hypothetical protein
MYGPGQTVIPLVPLAPFSAAPTTRAMASAPTSEPPSMTPIAVALGGALAGISLIVAVVDGLGRAPVEEPPAAALSQLPSERPAERPVAPALPVPVYEAPAWAPASRAPAALAPAAPSIDDRLLPTFVAGPDAGTVPERPTQGDWEKVRAVLLPRTESLNCADLQLLLTACRETGAYCARHAAELRAARKCP